MVNSANLNAGQRVTIMLHCLLFFLSTSFLLDALVLGQRYLDLCCNSSLAADQLQGVSGTGSRLYIVKRNILYTAPLDSFNRTALFSFGWASANAITNHGLFYKVWWIKRVLLKHKINDTLMPKLRCLLVYQDANANRRIFFDFGDNQKTIDDQVEGFSSVSPVVFPHKMVPSASTVLSDCRLRVLYHFKYGHAHSLVELFIISQMPNSSTSVGPFFLEMSPDGKSLLMHFNWTPPISQYRPLISSTGTVPVVGFISSKDAFVHLWHLTERVVFLFPSVPLASSAQDYSFPVRRIPFEQYFDCDAKTLPTEWKFDRRLLISLVSIVTAIVLIFMVICLTQLHKQGTYRTSIRRGHRKNRLHQFSSSLGLSTTKSSEKSRSRRHHNKRLKLKLASKQKFSLLNKSKKRSVPSFNSINSRTKYAERSS